MGTVPEIGAVREPRPGGTASPRPGHAPRDFRILLPPGWVRISIRDDSQATVVALAESRARTAPPRERARVRSALVTVLGRAVSQAREAGGIDVLVSVDSVEGVPVPASRVVSHVEPDGGDDLAEVAEQLDGPAAEVSVVDIAAGRAVRRQSTRWAEQDGVSVVLSELAFWVPVPGRTGRLVLTFATPSAELAPVLLQLFDAMGASLRWTTR